MVTYNITPSAPPLEMLLEDYCLTYEEFRTMFITVPPLPPIEAPFEPVNRQKPTLWKKLKDSFKKTKFIFTGNQYKRIL